jgi:DNA-directed RNA polymerase alpha subunit
MSALVRALNALRAEGVSIEQAARMPDGELLRVPGIGRKMLRELREHLAQQPVQITIRVPAHAAPHITAVVQAFGGEVEK